MESTTLTIWDFYFQAPKFHNLDIISLPKVPYAEGFWYCWWVGDLQLVGLVGGGQAVCHWRRCRDAAWLPASRRPGASPPHTSNWGTLLHFKPDWWTYSTKAKNSETVSQNVSFLSNSCLPQVFCHSIGKPTNSQDIFILTHPNPLSQPGSVVPDPSG